MLEDTRTPGVLAVRIKRPRIGLQVKGTIFNCFGPRESGAANRTLRYIHAEKSQCLVIPSEIFVIVRLDLRVTGI